LRPAAAYFDNCKTDVFCQLVGIADHERTPEVLDAIFRPIAVGGRGLTRATEILETSFVASQAASARVIKQSSRAEEKKDSKRSQVLGEALDEVKRKLGREKQEEVLPKATAESFLEHYSKDENTKEAAQLGKSIRKARRKNLEAKLETEAKASREKRARLHTGRARGASFLTTTIPTKEDLRMDNDTTSISNRLAVGLPPQAHMPLQCLCRGSNSLYSFDPWHAFSSRAIPKCYGPPRQLEVRSLELVHDPWSASHGRATQEWREGRPRC
jgi:hypothetical protein